MADNPHIMDEIVSEEVNNETDINENLNCSDELVIGLITGNRTSQKENNVLDEGMNSLDEGPVDFINVRTQRTIEEYNAIAMQRSEEAYIQIVNDVVDKSSENLIELRSDKKALRTKFVDLFTELVEAQVLMLFIIIIIGCKSMIPMFNLSNEIILTFMTTVLVETLGVITLMITFAFKSSEEIKIIDILNSVVGNYQKYKSTEEKDKAKK